MATTAKSVIFGDNDS